MKVDTIRAFFVHLTALVVVVGGLAIIYATRADQTASELRLLIGGFIGSALTFLFSAEVATRATHATLAAQAGQQPTMQVNTAPDQPVTVNTTGVVDPGDGADSDEPVGDPT